MNTNGLCHSFKTLTSSCTYAISSPSLVTVRHRLQVSFYKSPSTARLGLEDGTGQAVDHLSLPPCPRDGLHTWHSCWGPWVPVADWAFPQTVLTSTGAPPTPALSNCLSWRERNPSFSEDKREVACGKLQWGHTSMSWSLRKDRFGHLCLSWSVKGRH